MRRLTVILFSAVLVFAQVKQFKPGFNLFSPEQDIQMGKEAAAEVERTRPVVRNDELSGYLARVGARLARSRYAGQFGFRFSVVNDPHVNAVAFPGGPIYVNTGLLAVLDNESQLAGVLAHEMSHVALRHGTHQASKAILIQGPAAAAEALIRDDSNLAEIARLGISFTANSVLLRYSRDNEREADLNGALIMNDTGYNPVEMERFFEKLERQGEGGGLIASWFSDHPAPANRVREVDDEIRQLPRASYSESEPRTLARAKRIVAGLPHPPRSLD